MSENNRTTSAGAHSVSARNDDAVTETVAAEERRERRGLFGRRNRDRDGDGIDDRRETANQVREVPPAETRTTGDRRVEEYSDLSQHPEDRRRNMLNDDDEGPATQRHEAIREPVAAVPMVAPAASETTHSDTAIYDRQAFNEGMDAERDREAEREARQRALGVRSRVDEPVAAAAPVRYRRTTDRWHGSLALLVLRVVTAGILGVRAWQHISHLTRTQEYYSHSILPHWAYWGWAVGLLEGLLAVLIFLGLLHRLAGLLLIALEVATLALFVWGKVSPFSDARVGFNGELELLLAAVGLVYLLLGSGGLGIDAAFRRGREERREERALGNRV